jgi:predicted DNA-binding transcriptional regulator AlpA
MTQQIRILSKKEAAARLGISERTLDRVRELEMARVQLSARRVGYREDGINSYIERGGQRHAAAA